MRRCRWMFPMDLTIRKSDRYLRVTVLLNNDTAPFEGTLEFLTAQSSLEAYQYSYPLSLAAGEKFEQEYYIPLGVRADQMFVSVQDVNGGNGYPETSETWF